MDKYDIFINEYNKLENILSQLSGAPNDANMKWLEDTLDDIKMRNKLYLCRIMRNYIQHNTDYSKFINITDEMIDFIRYMYKLVYSKLVTVDEYMIPLKKCIVKEINDNIYDTVQIMNSKNYDFIPILENSKLTGIFSKNTITNIFMNDKINKKSTFKAIDEKFIKINKDEIKLIKSGTLLNDIIALFESSKSSKKILKMCIITDTGNIKGNVLGIITEFDL